MTDVATITDLMDRLHVESILRVPGPISDLLEEANYALNELLDDATKAAELQRTFDLRWAADMRAIKRWQETHPGNDLVWPDRADMVVWLLERDAELRKLRDRARVAAEYRLFGSPHEWTDEDSLAMANYVLALVGDESRD